MKTKKKITHELTSVSINGSCFYLTNINIWNNIKYTVPQVEEYEFNTFEEAYNFLKSCDIHGVEARQTILRRKIIEVFSAMHIDSFKISNRNFKTLKIKIEQRDCEKRASIDMLAKKLTANEFVEWLKDNQINYIIKR